jgi:hypothetical protein
MSNGSQLETRSYSGATVDEANERLATDAQMAARAGFEVVTQEWNGTTVTVAYQHRSAARQPRARGLSMTRGWMIVAAVMAVIGFVAPIVRQMNHLMMLGYEPVVTNSALMSAFINGAIWFFIAWGIFLVVRYLRSR